MICVNCGSNNIERVRNIASNGASQVFELCLDCEKNSRGPAIYLKREETGKPEQYRVVNDYRKDAPACSRCGATIGSEYHHWAPQHIFSDANSWPGNYLCVPCHIEWHKTMIAHILSCPSCRRYYSRLQNAIKQIP